MNHLPRSPQNRAIKQAKNQREGGESVKLFTVKQAMEILGVKQATMYKILSENQLPHVKVRGRKQINENDLKRYIEEQTSKPLKIDDLKGIKRFKYKPGMKIVE